MLDQVALGDCEEWHAKCGTTLRREGYTVVSAHVVGAGHMLRRRRQMRHERLELRVCALPLASKMKRARGFRPHAPIRDEIPSARPLGNVGGLGKRCARVEQVARLLIDNREIAVDGLQLRVVARGQTAGAFERVLVPSDRTRRIAANLYVSRWR